MAISIQIYSNANSSSKTVLFDFVGEILAANHPDFTPTISNVASTEYFFKVTTSARQDNNVAYPVKIVRSLSELALNSGTIWQKQRIQNASNAYPDVKSMVVDYVYDFVAGHSANLYGSYCTVQLPMKF
jgi:hypothetical protein